MLIFASLALYESASILAERLKCAATQCPDAKLNTRNLTDKLPVLLSCKRNGIP